MALMAIGRDPERKARRGRQGPRSASPRQQLAAALLRLPEAERVKTKPLLPYLATRNFDRLFASTVRRLVAGLDTELGEK